MTHLTPDQLIDAIEGGAAPHLTAHLAGCAHCEAQVTGLRAVLCATRAVDVPEPSPLFWHHFSSRVRDAVAQEGAPEASPWQWRRWPVFAPLGAVALVVLALAAVLPRPGGPLVPVETTMVRMESAPEAPDHMVGLAASVSDGVRWGAFSELVGDLDWDAAAAAGLSIAPGATYQAVLDLTAEERHELHRLLVVELQRPQS